MTQTFASIFAHYREREVPLGSTGSSGAHTQPEEVARTRTRTCDPLFIHTFAASALLYQQQLYSLRPFPSLGSTLTQTHSGFIHILFQCRLQQPLLPPTRHNVAQPACPMTSVMTQIVIDLSLPFSCPSSGADPRSTLELVTLLESYRQANKGQSELTRGCQSSE